MTLSPSWDNDCGPAAASPAPGPPYKRCRPSAPAKHLAAMHRADMWAHITAAQACTIAAGKMQVLGDTTAHFGIKLLSGLVPALPVKHLGPHAVGLHRRLRDLLPVQVLQLLALRRGHRHRLRRREPEPFVTMGSQSMRRAIPGSDTGCDMEEQICGDAAAVGWDMWVCQVAWTHNPRNAPGCRLAACPCQVCSSSLCTVQQQRSVYRNAFSVPCQCAM